MTDDQPMLLLIEGSGGERYALPTEALEQFLLPEGATTPDAKPASDSDVEGFGWGWNWNFYWTPPNRLVGNDGASLIGNDSAGFRNNRYWG